LQDKIRLLQDDLEVERELRQRVSNPLNKILIYSFTYFYILKFDLD